MRELPGRYPLFGTRDSKLKPASRRTSPSRRVLSCPVAIQAARRIAGVQMAYDFRRFIESVRDLGFIEIIDAAQHEGDRVKAAGRSRDGPLAKDAGSVQYVAQIERLRYWLRNFSFPAGMTDEDRGYFRDIPERLGPKGQVRRTSRGRGDWWQPRGD